MTSDGCGEEKTNCNDIRWKRVASMNNNFTTQNGIGNGKSDMSCINNDNKFSIESDEDAIASNDDSFDPTDGEKEVDLQASEYQGQKPVDIPALNESFDELLEKYKSFKRACDESRICLLYTSDAADE